MTATDELRRLLDERGVEYEVDDAKTVRVTRWRAYGDWVSFIEYDNGDTKFCIDARRLTPEQAIAATLGPGTCRNDAKPMAQQENDRLKAENEKLISVLHEVEAEAVDAYLCLQHDCELLVGELDDRFRKYWHEQDQNEKLRELVRDIEEVADPYLWEYIGRRMGTLGIEVDE